MCSECLREHQFCFSSAWSQTTTGRVRRLENREALGFARTAIASGPGQHRLAAYLHGLAKARARPSNDRLMNRHIGLLPPAERTRVAPGTTLLAPMRQSQSRRATGTPWSDEALLARVETSCPEERGTGAFLLNGWIGKAITPGGTRSGSHQG